MKETPTIKAYKDSENEIQSLRERLAKAEAACVEKDKVLNELSSIHLGDCNELAENIKNALSKDCGSRILAQLEAAEEMAVALKMVSDWFMRLRDDHDEKLGNSFGEACKNWPFLSQEPLSMQPIWDSLAAWEKARGEG